VKARAWKTLKWQIANGIQFVRTHVDVSDPTLTALKAMLEVKQEVAPWVELQIVAFPRRGFYLTPMARPAGGGPAAGGRCGRGDSAL
jgi:cytosine deaminase